MDEFFLFDLHIFSLFGIDERLWVSINSGDYVKGLVSFSTEKSRASR